jgi:hypothetical protein
MGSFLSRVKNSKAYQFANRYAWIVGVGMILYGFIRLVFRI